MKINLSADGLSVTSKTRKPKAMKDGTTRGAEYSFTYVTPKSGITEDEARSTLASLGSAKAVLRLVCKAVSKDFAKEAFALATGAPTEEQKRKDRAGRKLDKVIETLLAAGFTAEEIAAKFGGK